MATAPLHWQTERQSFRRRHRVRSTVGYTSNTCSVNLSIFFSATVLPVLLLYALKRHMRLIVYPRYSHACFDTTLYDLCHSAPTFPSQTVHSGIFRCDPSGYLQFNAESAAPIGPPQESVQWYAAISARGERRSRRKRRAVDDRGWPRAAPHFAAGHIGDSSIPAQ